MIWLYSGTPGSGKSYCATVDIYKKLKRKNKNKVIANYPLNLPKNLEDNFIYRDNSELTIPFLIKFAQKNHKLGVEGQTLVVIDEAQIIFNSRSWNKDYGERMEWIKFFSQHRKLGYNIIMIAQFDRMIDRQIRSLVEYEVSHMKMGNYFWFLPGTIFLCVERWYGQKMKTGHYFRIYKKKYAKLYDSYTLFDGQFTTWET